MKKKIAVGVMAMIGGALAFVVGVSGLMKTLEKKPAYEISVKLDPKPSAPRFDERDLKQAVLDRMFPKVDYLSTVQRYPEDTLKRARYKLKCFQDWVNTLQEGQVRDAYQTYVDGFARDYDQVEENNRKPPEEPVDKDEAERLDRQKRANALQIPKPPKAMCLSTEKP